MKAVDLVFRWYLPNRMKSVERCQFENAFFEYQLRLGNAQLEIQSEEDLLIAVEYRDERTPVIKASLRAVESYHSWLLSDLRVDPQAVKAEVPNFGRMVLSRLVDKIVLKNSRNLPIWVLNNHPDSSAKIWRSYMLSEGVLSEYVHNGYRRYFPPKKIAYCPFLRMRFANLLDADGN